MISPEMMLNFVKQLCNNINNNNPQMNLLLNNNFRIIVNSNPYARMKVESGEYCKRTNLNNVDINRNWDIFWGNDIGNLLNEENPGPKPFSEIETRFVLESIRNFNAKLFLTIHSGVYGLYMPYAYLEREGILYY
jgi:hypothetical protein